MGGHVLWLEANVFDVINNLLAHLSDNGRITIKEINDMFAPILSQTALHEQHGVMRKMEEAGLSRTEISRILGYEKNLVDEILSLDWNEEYDYSQFREMRPFSVK
jgi:hypothetical protein